MTFDAADIDADSYPEIVTTDNGKIAIFDNNQGIISSAATLLNTSLSCYAKDIILEDLDGNQFPELIIGNYNTQNAIFRNNQGQFDPTPFWLSSTIEPTVKAHVFNIYNDNTKEIVFLKAKGGVPEIIELVIETNAKTILITNPNDHQIIRPPLDTIRWQYTGDITQFDIFYSVNNGSTWNSIITGYSPSITALHKTSTKQASYAWNVPNIYSNQCKIKIKDSNSETDIISNLPFTIQGVAVIALNNDSLDFNSTIDSLEFQIENTGADTLIWRIEETTPELEIVPGNGKISIGTTQTIAVKLIRTGIAQGEYVDTIKIISNGGNKNFIIHFIVQEPITNISDKQLLNQSNISLTMFPNPFNSFLTLRINNYDNTYQDKANFQVYNILGTLIFENVITLHSGENSIKWEPRFKENSGLLLFKVTIKDQQLLKKAIILGVSVILCK